MTPDCCSSRAARRARRVLLLALLAAVAAAAALLPAAARPHDPGASAEVVAEALFLCDHLPPGGRDLNLSVAAHRAQPDPATGAAGLALAPRAQLAMAISERVGFTADVGIATEGRPIDAPGASLKLLLRPPLAGRTGLAASLDVFGSTRALGESEVGVGLGAIRSFARAALRAGASVATPLGAWSPHLHGGASAAAALGTRWRALAEVVGDLGPGGASLSVGPAVKLAVDDGTAVMAGALFPLTGGGAGPTFALQLTHGL
jgi:hypothetical protein